MNDITDNHADGTARTAAAQKRARVRKSLEFIREKAEEGDGNAMHFIGAC